MGMHTVLQQNNSGKIVFRKVLPQGYKINDVIMPMGFAMYHAFSRRKYAQRQYPNDEAYNDYG